MVGRGRWKKRETIDSKRSVTLLEIKHDNNTLWVVYRFFHITIYNHGGI